MEELLAKLKEAQDVALHLQAQSKQFDKVVVEEHKTKPQDGEDLEEFASEQDDWLQCYREMLGSSLDRPLVVLSLFDGIGGAWAALDRLGISYVGYSSEINPYALRVTKSRFSNVKHLGDVRKLKEGDIPEGVDLVVGGFPCQDLTSLGKKDGLHGSRSRLFFDMLRVLHVFKPKWFLVENVASMTWIDREEISKYLDCHPIEIDSQELTPNKRRRLYWTNIPHPRKMPQVREHRSNLLQSVLDDATALEQKIGCILSNNHHVGGFGELQRVYDKNNKSLRYITLVEVEKLLGFPAGHTDVDFGDLDSAVWDFEQADEEFDKQLKKSNDKGLSIRWSLLGNSFSVPVISYVLSPLLTTSTWETRSDHQYSATFKENECAVLEPGEIWALYNTRGHPSWYAVILSRSGGRFAMSQTKVKKKSLRIQVCFMELDPKYLTAEGDKWSPIRGTGFYLETESLDTQDSFVTLSHKMCGFKNVDGGYFIYPGKDEVWAVHDRNCTKPALYYVFVEDVQIDLSQLTMKTFGSERFVARCRLMQQTVLDVYRRTETVLVCKDLAQFSFKVPYYFKGDASMFRLELSKNSRKYFSVESRTPRKRRSCNEDEEDEDEDYN